MIFNMYGVALFLLVLYLPWVSYGTSPSALSSKALCDAALETIVFFQPGSTEIIPHDHVLVENRFVGPALIRVLNRYANEHRLPPKLRRLSGDEEKAAAWKRDIKANEKLPGEVADSGPPWRAIKGGTDPVYDVVIGGKRKVFREVDTYLDLRLTIAASIINEAIGIEAVPKAQLVILNGRVGATSEFVDGIGLPQLNQKKPLQRLLEAGSLNPHSYSEAMAFEFIAGNSDAKKIDCKIRPDGSVVTVDHNYAFTRGVPEHFPAQSALGSALPEKYTPRFAEAILSLSLDGNAEQRSALIESLRPHLNSEEIDAFFFRVEVVADDIRNRRPAALFTVP